MNGFVGARSNSPGIPPSRPRDLGGASVVRLRVHASVATDEDDSSYGWVTDAHPVSSFVRSGRSFVVQRVHRPVLPLVVAVKFIISPSG